MIVLNATLSKCLAIQAKIKWINMTIESREKYSPYYERSENFMANFKESLKNIDFLNLAVVAIGIVGAILSGKQEAQREKQMEATITEKVNDALKKRK